MTDLNEIEHGQLCQSTIESLYAATGGLKHFPGLLKKIIRYRSWERRVDRGKVFELSGLRELITAKPIRGWGEDPKKVEAVIRDDPEALAMYRDAMVEKPGKPTAQGVLINNNIINKNTGHTAVPIQGTSRSYSISRVQRECDEKTVAAVMSGEMSPHAALVKAGIREDRQIYIPRDPAKAAEKLRSKFGVEFVEEMWALQMIKEHGDDIENQE